MGVIIACRGEYSLISLSFPILKLIKITYEHPLIRHLMVHVQVSSGSS
jgi:hypothetical protein